MHMQQWHQFLQDSTPDIIIENNKVISFDDSAAERLALTNDTLICDLSHLGLLELEGADTLKFLQGTWRLQPLNDGIRTRLRYSVRIGVAAPVPGFIIRSALEADVPKLLKALRAETVAVK